MLDKECGLIQATGASEQLSDVREETKVEIELRAQEERLTAALTASGAGTYYWNLADEIKIDAALSLLMGLSAEPRLLTLKDFCEFVHPDDRAFFWEENQQLARQEGEFESEYRLLLADGTVHWLFDKGRVVRGPDGQLHHMTGTCVDITSRKKMEEELRASQAWLRNALSVGRMGTWQLHLDTKMVVASDGTEPLWGFDVQRVRPLEDYLRLIHPDDLLLVNEVLANLPPQFRLEFRVRPPGREEMIWLAVQGERELDPQGRPLSLMGAVSDISSHKHTEQMLQNQTLELEARVRELNCLHAVSRLIQAQGTLDQLLQQVVDVIPAGFARPHNVQVRLTCEGKVFQSPGFRPGRASLSQELRAQEQVVGHLEIHRVMPEAKDGEVEFGYGEQTLLPALAKPLSRAIEKAQVLRALSESEDRWRTMMGALAEGVVLFDRDGRVQVWNRSAERLLGCELMKGQSLEGILGLVLREDGTAFPVADFPAQVTLRTGVACDDVVVGLTRPSGLISWLSINSRPLFRGEDQELYGVVVSFTEITERKLTEETIRREVEAKELERRRLSAVLDSLPVAVYIADQNGELLQASTAAAELWGEVPLPTSLARYHLDYPAYWAKTGLPVGAGEWGLARAVQQGEVVRAEEMDIARSDGSRRTIINYARPIHNQDDTIVGGVGVSVDITERKQSEVERAHLAAIVKASPDAIVSTDLEGRITSWNGGAEQIYGYCPEEILGQSIAVLMPPECQDELEMILKAIARGQGVTYFDSVRLNKQGERIDVSVAVTPITDGTGKVMGAAKIDRNISERKRLEQQLQYDAFHDRLTGVANRSLFMDRLEHVVARAERFDERFAVFVMDMDNFKLINDSFGHLLGDKLLCAFVNRIQELLRPVDTLSRFGGDEFTLLLEEIEDQTAVEQVASRILEALQRPFMLDGHEILVGSSIGIMLGDAACRNADQALLDADVALYEAKRQGKNQYVVFDARMRGEKVSRLYLEAELRRALQEVDLTVQYQPIINLQTNQAVGCEALVRWVHPVMGEVDPSRFIDVAEETGLISSLGRFVLDRACASLAEWLSTKAFPADFYVSVNVSPKEFYSRDLVPFIQSILGKHQLQGANLRLEVTENVIIRHDREAAAILRRLQSMGIHTCLDDFGTGYSSLSYLHQLPFNIIKVDRSFIQSLTEKRQSREVVRSILGLAEALEMQAVAEGVETPEQLAYARALGFRWVQGYVLHQPLERSEMVSLFESSA